MKIRLVLNGRDAEVFHEAMKRYATNNGRRVSGEQLVVNLATAFLTKTQVGRRIGTHLGADHLIPGERWKPIKKYPDYEISDHGRVRRKTAGRGTRKGLYKAFLDDGRYLYVNLHNARAGLKPRNIAVHRLVALHWLRRPRGATEVDHLAGDTHCNVWKMLQWSTRQVNAGRGERDGEKNNRAHLTNHDARQIRKLHPRLSAREIAVRFNVSLPTVKNVLAFRTYRDAR